MSSDIIALSRHLESRPFIGNYFAKQYVRHLNQYKDVILLHPHESIFAQDLQNLHAALIASNCNKWFGYQNEPAIGISLWTVLDTNDGEAYVFGEYQFEVQMVKHTKNSVELLVQPVRRMESSESITDVPIGSLLYDGHKFLVEWLVSLDMWISRTYRRSREAITQFCRNDITWPNIKSGLYMLCLLCIAGVKSSVGMIWSLGEFSLRFIDGLERLMRATTPIALAILNLLGKIIGGAYILLAMIWRDLFGSNVPADRRTRAAVSFPGYGRQTAHRQQQYIRRATGYNR